MNVSAQVSEDILVCELYNISLTYFTPGSTLVVLYSSLNYSQNASFMRTTCIKLLNKLHEKMMWPTLVTTSSMKDHMKTFEKPSSYIFLVHTLNDVKQQLNNIKLLFSVDVHGYILIIVFDDKIVKRYFYVKEIFHELKNQNILNAVVVIPNGIMSQNKYFPFTEKSNNCYFEVYANFMKYMPMSCEEEVQVKLVNQWNVQDKTIVRTNFFPNKMPRNFNGCPFQISTFEYEPMVMKPVNQTGEPFHYADGLEVRFLETILKPLNLVPSYRYPPPAGELWGKPVNGTYNGVFGEVVRGVSDATIVMNVLDIVRASFAVPVYPHIGLNLAWNVPCAKPMPRWSSLIRIFSPSVWLELCFTYIAASVFICIYSRLQLLMPRNYSNLQECFLNLWAVIMNVSVSSCIPTRNLFRIMFIFWVLYSFVITNLYLAFLTTFFVDPGLESELKAEEDLLKTDLSLGFHPHMAYRHSELKSLPYRKQIVFEDTRNGIRRLALKKDMAFLISTFVGSYSAIFLYPTADGKPGFCQLKEEFSRLWICIYLQKGSPLQETFSKNVLKVWESGMFEKWNRDIIYSGMLSARKRIHQSEGSGFAQFSLEHLQAAFYSLILGYLISLAIFVFELFIKCCFSRTLVYSVKTHL
ncbi:hypothetical protein L9F63_014327 [Diploptera punctata]|uniref:Ionotropic glutamate receptor C-terminal domain-containing protein n=1 Tax=Diploptera punctata TaxID=6984 RepID=A0AAD8EKR2_DIPPU|nr:hypothetical protein L9F63_014327 [Diploptera punctata]